MAEEEETETQIVKVINVGPLTLNITLAPVWEAGVGGELFPGAVQLGEYLHVTYGDLEDKNLKLQGKKVLHIYYHP